MLKFDQEDAEAAASSGDPPKGFVLLSEGLRRAEEARDAGQPWGDEPVRRYQEVIDRYVQQHPIRR